MPVHSKGGKGESEPAGLFPAFFSSFSMGFVPPLLVFLALAGFRLGGYSLWLDEIMSVDFCDGSLSELFARLRRDVHSPVFYLSVWAFLKTGGFSEWLARLPAVLSGAAAVAALFFLAREIRDERLARTASFLLAVSPFFIEFSREVHPYSMSALWSVLTWLFFLRLLKRGRTRDAAAYGVCCALSPFTVYLSGLVIITQLVYFLFSASARRKKIKVLAAWGASALLFSPWLFVFFEQLEHQRELYGGFAIQHHFPEGIAIGDAIAVMGEVYMGEAARGLGRAALVAAVSAVTIPGIFLVARGGSDGKRPGGMRHYRRTVFWMFWGPVAMFVGLCVLKPILLARYLTMSAPFAALFFAAAMVHLPKRARIAALSAWVGFSLLGYGLYLGTMPREDWRGAADRLLDDMKPSDLVIVEDDTSLGCCYQYFELLGRADRVDCLYTYKELREVLEKPGFLSKRTLWFLYSEPRTQDPQLRHLRESYVAAGRMDLEADFALHLFKDASNTNREIP